MSEDNVVSATYCELALLPIGQPATVQSVAGHPQSVSLARRLAEIGFLPGEQVRVLTRAPGGFPLVARVGTSTFALRRHEAMAVMVKR